MPQIADSLMQEAQESVNPAEASTGTTQQVQANVPKSDAEEAVQRSASVEAQDTTKQPPTAPDPIKPKATAESTPASDTVQQKQTDSPILGTTVTQSTTQTNGVEPQNSFASFASNNAPFASAGANKPLFNFSTLANGSGLSSLQYLMIQSGYILREYTYMYLLHCPGLYC